MRIVPRHSFSVVILIVFGLITVINLGQVQKDEWNGGRPESWARQAAIKKVMPTYPAEALPVGISGRVEVKIAISEEGEVVRIKVRPRIDPRLKTAVADAVKQWKFKTRPDPQGLGRPLLSHLIFNFVSGRVVLHDPGPNAPDSEHLGYYNSAKEQRQWEEWEEVDLSQVPPQRSHP
ncbi:MAG TPA: TonB family protein [Pyrinomonadaceae bacterium]|nr:TonB family protein [Pyrinomonadaceae bacterium]